jgi:hypothetical protein
MTSKYRHVVRRGTSRFLNRDGYKYFVFDGRRVVSSGWKRDYGIALRTAERDIAVLQRRDAVAERGDT